MSDFETDYCRRRAEASLRAATCADTLKGRVRLLEDAMHWHGLAMNAGGHRPARLNDDADEDARAS